jgi:hypothetical protein
MVTASYSIDNTLKQEYWQPVGIRDYWPDFTLAVFPAVAQFFGHKASFMAKTLKIELAVPNALSVDGLVSSFQDFGEDVYRALRNECDISIEEIDHFVGAFHLSGIHKRDVRTIAAKVRKILEKYQRLTDVKIYEVVESRDE